MSVEEIHDPREAVWVKSSYSGAEGGQCVEVAASPYTVRVRDSKDKALTVSLKATAWSEFVGFAARHTT
ncbi:DUF397 domain-containing protein [Streptomyces sp. NPDC102365]|uniref:DUF397 domain-containing protein n=1 Tax=Streptomyces sp. NPDC102365 TaxID=3366162 RepID=UPI0037FB932D